MGESDIRRQQCDECGRIIRDTKNDKYAAIPTRAIPRHLRRGSNAVFGSKVGRICFVCDRENRHILNTSPADGQARFPDFKPRKVAPWRRRRDKSLIN